MTTKNDSSWTAVIYKKVDEFYTPAEGLKVEGSRAMIRLDNMILNFVGAGALMKKGLISASETWEIYMYLRATRKVFLERYAIKPSSLADDLPSTAEVAELCSTPSDYLKRAITPLLPQGAVCECGVHETVTVRNAGGTYACFEVDAIGFRVNDVYDTDKHIEGDNFEELARHVVRYCTFL
jgi:hypothetical protein